MMKTKTPTTAANIDDLIRLGVHYGAMDQETRWMFTNAYGDAFSLEATGYAPYSSSRPTIALGGKLGPQLRDMWPKNQYGVAIGARSLRRIIIDLGGQDIKSAIKDVKAAESRRVAQVRLHNHRINAVTSLQAAVDNLEAPGLGGTVDAIVALRGMWSLLNSMTRSDAALAAAVAYNNYNSPRDAEWGMRGMNA